VILDVTGTTCTRFITRFAMSLLTMIAGRVVEISPPVPAANSTQ
jgi:hypothetical protein